MVHLFVNYSKPKLTYRGPREIFSGTVVEVPPMRFLGVRVYKINESGDNFVFKDLFFKPEKQFKSNFLLPNKFSDKKDFEEIKNFEDVSKISVFLYSKPYLTGIGKKTSEVIEVGLGGNDINSQVDYILTLLGKDLRFMDIFSEKAYVYVHGVTKGKGYQGPVKRFGVQIRAKKSEKTKRGPGNISAWSAENHTMYRVAMAGRMGFHLRTMYSVPILKISNDLKIINPSAGFNHYGFVKNDYVILKGSLFGTQKRPLVFAAPQRKDVKQTFNFDSIEKIVLKN
jgi:large subunit ribosomal protein L3